MGETAYEKAKASGQLISQRLREPDTTMEWTGENGLMHEAADMIDWLSNERDSLIAEVTALQDALHEIQNWCRAYPRTVFIEPTKEQWAEADKILEAHKPACPGLTAISGSNMRHVVEGIQKIIDKAIPSGRESS